MKKLFNNFRLLGKAFRATRREASASIVILLFFTMIFTVILWISETGYSFWDALIWVVVKYVEDPAEVATAPVTLFGQIIGTLVGIFGIAIFAVPAGLIGSGLLDAMKEEQEQEIKDKNSKTLHKRFRRIAHSASFFTDEKGNKITLKCVPRYRSLPHIIMKTGLTEDKIIEAVDNCPDMRLMNTAATHPAESKAKDELVVVNFPLNNE